MHPLCLKEVHDDPASTWDSWPKPCGQAASWWRSEGKALIGDRSPWRNNWRADREEESGNTQRQHSKLFPFQHVMLVYVGRRREDICGLAGPSFYQGADKNAIILAATGLKSIVRHT